MIENIAEIRGYYGISKCHARVAFYLAVGTSILGFVLLAIFCFKSFETGKTDVLTLIAGGVSELFAGTALLVFNSSTKQLNHYYEELHDNEMFLATISLVDRLPDDKKADTLITIIEKALVIMTDTPGETATDNPLIQPKANRQGQPPRRPPQPQHRQTLRKKNPRINQ